MIRLIQPADIPEVVSLHLQSFSGFFLSYLGHNFLKVYYTRISEYHDGICLAYIDKSDRLIGFVVGSKNPQKFYKLLLKNYWHKFVLASMRAIIKKPSVVKRLAKALFFPSKNPVGDNIVGLFSICVNPKIQNIGIGRELILSFFDEVQKRNCKSVCLTTDRDYNQAANKFYRKMGFYLKRKYTTPENRHMNEYWINLKFG